MSQIQSYLYDRVDDLLQIETDIEILADLADLLTEVMATVT